MIINGDGGYGLLAAYIGGLAAQVGRLGPKVSGHLAPFLYSSREPSELSQWLCYDDSTINIIVIIIFIFISFILLLLLFIIVTNTVTARGSRSLSTSVCRRYTDIYYGFCSPSYLTNELEYTADFKALRRP